jgi:hypothetical protein
VSEDLDPEQGKLDGKKYMDFQPKTEEDCDNH